uniref:Uncharacterized protein n=1 Tax=Arundo donax TaxID=35708 RepID=A0A0A9EAF9_ARUDO
MYKASLARYSQMLQLSA